MEEDTRVFIKLPASLWDKVFESGIDYNAICTKALNEALKTAGKASAVNEVEKGNLAKKRSELQGNIGAIKAFSKNKIDESTDLVLQKMQDEIARIDAELEN